MRAPVRRLDSLTGLRFLAAVVVFALHANGLLRDTPLRGLTRFLVSGHVGVSFFFVLSGFVLMWTRRDGDEPRRFWRRRVARIVPAYWVAWCLGAVLTLAIGSAMTRSGTVLSFLLIQSWRPEASTFFAVNGPSWSLSCEMFFYLVSPWLLPALAALPRPRRRRLLVAVMATATLLPLVLATADPGPTLVWAVTVFPPTRLLEFVVGALVALEVADGAWRRVQLRAALLASLAALLVVGTVGVGRSAQALTLVPLVLVIAAAAHRDLSGAHTPFSGRTWVTLGVWSYAFYLVHELVLRTMSHLIERDSTAEVVLVWLGALAVSVIAAGTLHRFVERPFEQRLRGRREVTPLAA